jgi:hypothetical protein
MSGKLTLVLVVMLLVVTRPASAQRFMFTGCPDADVLTYFQKLQKTIAAGDRAGVAGMVKYPLRVNRDSTRHAMVASAAELLKQYDAVFTPTIRQAIISETPAKLAGGRDGVAIKGGVVWLAGIPDRSEPPKCHLGVSSVNLHAEK